MIPNFNNLVNGMYNATQFWTRQPKSVPC